MLDRIPMADRDTNGDLYAYLLSKIASAEVNGQFRTPRHIIKLMVDMTAPQPSDEICDPACGTADFLVAASEYVRATHVDALLDAKQRSHFHRSMFHGFDFDATMLRIGSMNMLLHGVESPDVCYRDTLSEDASTDAARYTLILATPRFAGSLDYEATAKDLQRMVKTKKNELLFVDRRWAFWMLKSLQLEIMNKSAAVPGLNCDDVYRLEVNLPSVPEQVRIASILDHADALRAKRPQVRGHLDTLTESIFQEMFASEPSTARSKRSPCRFERTRSEASYCITSLSMRASPFSVSTMSSATSSAGPSDASIKAIPAPLSHIHLQREFAERPSSGRRSHLRYRSTCRRQRTLRISASPRVKWEAVTYAG